MRYFIALLVIAVLGWIVYSSVIAPNCSFCTQPDAVKRDVQNAGNNISNGVQRITRPIDAAINEATTPIREAIEKKKFEGIEAGKAIASEVDNQLTLFVTCGSGKIEGNSLTLNCIFDKPANDLTEGLPSIFFIVDGKFTSPVNNWTEGENWTFNTTVTIPENATGVAFVGDNVKFTAVILPGWNTVNGDGQNYGGWLKAQP